MCERLLALPDYLHYLVGEGIVKIKGRINPCHVKFPLVNEVQNRDDTKKLLGELFKAIKIY